MRQARFIFIVILICFYLWGYSSPRPTLARSAPGPTVTQSDETGLSLAWAPPAYDLTTREVAGEPYVQIRMPGTSLSAQPGYPQLPFYSGLIGLPATGGARLHVVRVEREIVPLPHPPLPAPVPQPVRLSTAGLPSTPTGGLTTLSPDPAAYASDAFYPAAIATLGPAQKARDRRVARLTINPLRVNPVSGQMEVVRYLHLKITFERAAFKDPTRSDPFTRALALTLVNPEATQWSAISPSSHLQTIKAANNSLSDGDALKVSVSEAGLYALTYQDLLGAGMPVATLDPRTLQLSHSQPRQEIAIWVEGQSDGVFDPGDRLLFYAAPTFSRFVDQDVYFLSHGLGTGLRMADQSASPDGLPAGSAWRTTTVEINQHYDPHYPGRDGDHWYWDELRQPERTSADYAFQLEAPLTSGPDATLTLWLQSYTDPDQDPDHRVSVAVNGTAVGAQTWNGIQAISITLAVPASILEAGDNQLTLSLPGIGDVSVEGVWLDAFALTYPTRQGGTAPLAFQGQAGQNAYTLVGWPNADLAVYEITAPSQPRRLNAYTLSLAGATYTLALGDANTSQASYLVVPDDPIKAPLALETATRLDDPPGGADYIIVTHPDFAQAIAPLAAHRAAQGLRVITVDVNAVYDTYGSGRMDPAAIKSFIKHAFDTWTPPAPMYVLLVGDGSFDFKNYSGYNPQNFIPPYLAHVDPWWGETAADNQFVTVAGEDSFPDLIIGRLPVNSQAEAETVVDKILHYETNPTAGPWNSYQLFVADDPDSAGDFHAEADLGYTKVTTPFIGQRFYYSSAASDQPHVYTDTDKLRTSFLNKFNQGASLVTFHGHSSWHQWSVAGLLRWSSDPELNDVAAFRNRYRLPVVLGMTCFTAFFHHPNYPTLDESLLRQPGGGAIAAWGSSGLGISTGHRSLQEGFYEAVADQGMTNLGAAILAGKTKLYASGFHQDLLDTFNLLGDPALDMNFTIVPLSHKIYLPYARR
jgi:hypothetical protein